MVNIKENSTRTLFEIEGKSDILPEFLTKKENVIIFDWFTGTSKIDEPQAIIAFLGLGELEFQEIHGFYSYNKRLYYDGISIHYDGQDGMGVCLEMSGQGCRVFETFGTGDWNAVFKKFCGESNAYRVTRLDIAFDDFTVLLPLLLIVEFVRKKLYIAKARNAFEIRESDKGLSLSIGSKKSDVLIRFYDKAAERGYGDGVHWVRCELQLRRERAENFIRNEKPIGEKLAGVLNNYLRFVVENPYDDNKSRWETQPFWLNFVQTVEKISIFTKKDVDYNFDRFHRYVFHQCANSIDTVIQCIGVEKFLEQIRCRGSTLSEKHFMAINKFHAEKKKRAEKALEPYKCEICGKTKPKVDFSVYDVSAKTGKCRDCLCTQTK